MAFYKQSTAYTRMFKMIDSADHFSKKTGLTCTVNLSKAGAAFGAAGGTITEIANGWYKIALTTTDTNTVGDLAFYITATGADDTDFVDQVWVRDLADLAYPATSGRSMVVDAAGLVDANTVKLGPTGSGTAQTARDIGLSVLLATGQKVDVDTIKTNPVVNGGTVTFPTNATLASTTNITAGTITTVTAVTNQLTAAAIATGVWQDATAGDFTTASSIGKCLYISNVAPGGSGGHMISGSNAGTTTLAALTITGVTTLTGNVVLSDGLTISAPSTLNRAGLDITGNGTGAAMKLAAGATGKGIAITTTAGDGLSILPTAGSAIVATGNGTSKHGIIATGGTAGTSDGISAVAGTGGVDIRGNITGNLVGTVSTVTAVTGLTASNLDATISSRMATYTQPTGFLAATFPTGTVANTTNITAGTITTVTNLTNAPTAGDFTATMKTSLNAATPAVTVSDKTGFALTAAYDAAKTASQVGDIMKVSSGTGANQISLSSGLVTVGTNNDKTGYSLTQAFPTNFSSLAITAAGLVAITSNRKKAAAATFEFLMQDSTTGAPKTGLTVASVISKDGGSAASTTNAVTEIGLGQYQIVLTATEMTANNIFLQFTSTGAITYNLSLQTQP